MTQRKRTGTTDQTRKRTLRKSRGIEFEEDARSAYLKRLQEDKEFILESERIERALKELAMNYPAIYARFFRRATYLSLFIRDRFETLVTATWPNRAKEILQDYANYSRRFRVWMKRRGDGSFRVIAQGPFSSKSRISIVNGNSRAVDPEASDVPVFFNELYADDDLPVPTPQLEDILAAGKARFVQIDDQSGQNVLHDIELHAYDPEAVTFILHNSKRPYVFCLVGENVTIDKTWKAAGTVINSLQAKLYGRRKAGRPRKIKKLKKAIDLRKGDASAPLKERAFDLDLNVKNLASNQVYLSRLNATLRPKKPQD
jgi:hypothetical protein